MIRVPAMNKYEHYGEYGPRAINPPIPAWLSGRCWRFRQPGREVGARCCLPTKADLWFTCTKHGGRFTSAKNGRKPAGDVNWRCLASCLHWMFPAFWCVFPPWLTGFWHRQTKTCTKTLALGAQPAASQHSTLLGSCRRPRGTSRETNGVHGPPGPESEGLKLFCFL